MLRAARCEFEVICTFTHYISAYLSRLVLTNQAVTSHFQHAIELSKELPLDKYDAVVTVGGDGMIYEVLNGFAQHRDPMRALKIPLAPVPTGSGNGLAIDLLGMEVRYVYSSPELQ